MRVHGDDVSAVTDGIGGGEAGRDFLRHLAGCRPFDAALVDYDAIDGGERVHVVSESGVEDAAFAVAENHQAGLIHAGAFVGRVRVRRGEDGHVFAGTFEIGVELVALVHPDFGETLDDRVFGIADGHLIGNAIAVHASGAGRGVGGELAILIDPVGAGLFVATAPAADADHLVEGVPAAEGVIGGVHDDDAATVFHVLLEGIFEGLRPAVVGRVVVPDDDLGFAPLGFEGAEIRAGGRSGDDVDLEEAGFIEHFFEHGRG